MLPPAQEHSSSSLPPPVLPMLVFCSVVILMGLSVSHQMALMYIFTRHQWVTEIVEVSSRFLSILISGYTVCNCYLPFFRNPISPSWGTWCLIVQSFQLCHMWTFLSHTPNAITPGMAPVSAAQGTPSIGAIDIWQWICPYRHRAACLFNESPGSIYWASSLSQALCWALGNNRDLGTVSS